MRVQLETSTGRTVPASVLVHGLTLIAEILGCANGMARE